MEALGNGAVLIRSGNDFYFAFTIAGKPNPSAAELTYAGGVEFFLEGFEVAEGLLDYLAMGPVGSPPPWGFMMFQNMVWFTWPPPLLRTAPRMSSGWR